MDNKNKILKEFGASTFAVKNRTTVYVLTVMIVIFGFISYSSLPKENFPEVSVPTVYVGTPYPGNSPVEIEQLITRVLEKELKKEEGIDELTSSSVDGFSAITIQFDMDVETDDAVFRAKNAVDRASSFLPSDLPEDPLVKEIDLSEIPVLNVSFSGPYTIVELRHYAELLKEEAERYPAVSEGQIKGIDDREVHINIDPYEMDARNITFNDIKTAVSNEHINISGGDIISNGTRRSVRVLGEFPDPVKMENIIIKVEEGKPVYLRDIGSVDYTFIDQESYSRINAKETVTLDIIKRSGYNLLSTTEDMVEVIEDMKASTFPDDLIITLTGDQSKQTKDSLRELENNIITGMLLVIIVLLFFMNTRNAMFVGLAIPMSMLLSFVVMNIFGITLNTMVLFGLVMALGMLVDNGIVLVENVYRLVREGYSPIKATIYGAGEIAWPIIASTATTVAAFLPLALWPGMMGEFFKNLPITIAIVLSSSLFVALVINPTFIAYFMKEEDGEEKVNYKRVLMTSGAFIIVGVVLLLTGNRVSGNLIGIFGTLIALDTFVLSPLASKFQKHVLPRMENAYEASVNFALRGKNPYFFLGGTVSLLVVSIMLFKVFSPQVLFFPQNIPSNVYVMVEYPIGTDLGKTIETTVRLENQVYDVLGDDVKYVKSVVTSAGIGSSDPNGEIKAKGAGTYHEGIVKVEFIDFEDRIGVDTYAILKRIRDAISDEPGVVIKVDKNNVGPPVGKPIQIEISGYDFDGLMQAGNMLIEAIKESGIEGIETLSSDLELTKPEYQIKIDREKAAFYGLSTAQIGDEIRTAIFGKIIGKYKDRNDDWDIKVRFTEDYRYNAEALKNKILTLKNNKGEVMQIPVSAVADFELSSTFGMISRKQQQRVLSISSNVLPGYNATAVNNQIAALLPTLDIPNGYHVNFGGEQKEQAEEMAFLMQALMIAVFLIFGIIVFQFNKITAPLIIMASIVLSTIGVFLGLIIFEMDFVVLMTMMGIISLAGVVVNNAIVLIDFADMKKKEVMMNMKEGEVMTKELLSKTIAEAGKTRLIPVLLTAITTILGLFPMAVGMNIDFVQFMQDYDFNFYTGAESQAFWGPLAWTVIFGLTFATFLTLIVLPVMVVIIDRMKLKTGGNVA
ncbi:efflux RND transporter permease subunit [Sediminitomix flava]|uniref:Multidrug efflux pump subunit AcrB n=1 Tax=Sediminitomix flava TaxID=379075 RepID=A0A315ZGI9_SEDFL|nr:efflux RND transporter permease subunit [Sediminitomix flava]PWJ44269.1 multidrug efflux pump subunit AcrB [Sediminitomix flava]